MTSPTHIAFAEFLYLLLLTSTGTALTGLNAILIAVTSLFPDIDSDSTVMGKVFPFLSRRIERRFAHRTFTHSVLCVGAFGVAASPLLLLNPDLFVCALAGYASHPFLDTMTVNGVQLFYPFSRSRCVFPLEVNNPHRYRVKTGTRSEITLFAAFAFGCLPAFFVASRGHERFVRVTQKTVESALRDYNDLSRTSVVLAEIHAHNLLTKRVIAGVFEVVGALDERTMVFRAEDGEIHSLGSEYHAEYVAESVVCHAGPPVVVLVREFNMAGRFLGDIRGDLESGPDHQFFGTLRTADRVDIPVPFGVFCPITMNGDELRFNHASPGLMRAFGLEGIMITGGRLAVRTVFREHAVLPAPEVSQTRPTGYVRLLFAVGRGERLEHICAPGDSVSEGCLLASKTAQESYGERSAEARRNLEALLDEHAGRLAELDAALAAAGVQSTQDSLAVVHARVLHARGFLSAVSLGCAGETCAKARRKIGLLRQSRVSLERKYAAKADEIRGEIRRRTEREGADRSAQELRSPIDGIVVDVRREVKGEAVRLTITLQRS
jgi:inner membrane protein